MPLVEITLIAGRGPETVRDLIHQVHEAVRRSLDAPAQNIRVLVRELPPEHWAAGDVTIAERRAAPPAPGSAAPPDPREGGASDPRDEPSGQGSGASGRGSGASGREDGAPGRGGGAPGREDGAAEQREDEG
jgi:4-oxalocrotonate tautomerase